MKSNCVIRSFAKINLSIDVLGKLDNGYHEVDMIMQSISLHDLVIVEWIPAVGGACGAKQGKVAGDATTKQCKEAGDATTKQCKAAEAPIAKQCKGVRIGGISIELTTNRSFLPVDERNLACKAAMLMAEKYAGNRRGTLKINIRKMIPVAAGLAGGSGNGAAVILAINHLWRLGRDLNELLPIGGKLGADVPFCMMTQAKKNRGLGRKMNAHPMACCCAHATGTGTDLEPIRGGIREHLVLAKPGISVSTPEVYKGMDSIAIMARPDNILIKRLLLEDVQETDGLAADAQDGADALLADVQDGADALLADAQETDELAREDAPGADGLLANAQETDELAREDAPGADERDGVVSPEGGRSGESALGAGERDAEKRKAIYRNMINVLELYTLEKYPIVKKTKDRIREALAGAQADPVVLMSGSGPTVFGFAGTEEGAKRAREKLKSEYRECFWAETLV